MMKKLCCLLLLLIFIPILNAQESTDNLLEILRAIPDQPEIRESLISFIDYDNLFESRAGTPVLQSFADLEQLPEQIEAIYLAALRGINSGPGFTAYLFSYGAEWEATVGFDFVDINRAILFGNVPEDVTVLQGEFDLEAIEVAFTARNHTSDTLGDMTLWCGEAGCENGAQMDLANRNPANPFGGELGLSPPVLVSETTVASSRNDGLLILVEDAIGGRFTSLADNPTYVSALRGIAPDNLVIQATFVHPSFLLHDVASIITEDDAQELLEAMMEEASRLPQYEMVLLADTATEEEQVAYVILVYRDEADATTATEVVPERLATMDSFVASRPFHELLEEREIATVMGQVVVDEANERVLAVFEFRAPLASNEEDESSFGLVISSMVYRFLVQTVYQRDTAWLMTGIDE